MPAGLYDELPGLGEAARMVADEPETIVIDNPARSGHLAADLGTGGAIADTGAIHDASAIRSFSTQTLVAKKSRIIAVWSPAETRTTSASASVPLVFFTFCF